MPRTPESVARKRASVIWIAVWLWPLLSPAGAIVGGRVHPVAPAAAGLAAFVALYVRVVYTAFAAEGRLPERRRVVELFVLAALGLALAAGYTGHPPGWLALPLYIGAAGAAMLPAPWAFGWILGSVAALAVIGLAHHQKTGDIGSSAFSTLMACALVFVVRQMIGYIDELRATRAELAKAAVAEERLRFARDLHDLLGHTLSLVVVKAEVVRRLAPRDMAAAMREADDIEVIGRRALVEVREAVTGYRDRAFAVELDGARAALADAGIAVRVEETGTPLPAQADALFGWAVREGVTNVIRHSRARHCEILVRRTDARATLEIRDDGIGGHAYDAPAGNGLRGLSERLHAAGGALCAEPVADGGFRLTATLPAAVA